MIKIGQYNCIKQTASSALKVLSRDRVPNIPFKMYIIMWSWDPTLGSMQYLEYLKLLEYLLGVNGKGLGVQMAEYQLGMKLMCELMKTS